MITKTGSIFDVSLSQTIPPALERDKRMVALVEALARMGRDHAEKILDTVGLYYRIDQLSERVLDMLAIDFHIDWYDYDADVAEKRSVVKSAVAVHQLMGTPAGIRTMVESIYGDCEIEEWYVYGDDPYYFRIYLTGADALTEEDTALLEKRISQVKPVRARLRSVEAMREITAGLDGAAHVEGYSTVTIRMEA